MKKNVGLFFGSFNPIHIGHLIIADYIQQKTTLDEVWFVITPQSPFKQQKKLADNHLRMKMVETAIQNYPNLKACDIEFNLSQPNYTINTLREMETTYSDLTFTILMGSDNLENFHLWRDYQKINNRYPLYVYPRQISIPKNIAVDYTKVMIIEAPLLNISATQIRKDIKNGQLIKSMIPHGVDRIIIEKKLYY